MLDNDIKSEPLSSDDVLIDDQKESSVTKSEISPSLSPSRSSPHGYDSNNDQKESAHDSINESDSLSDSNSRPTIADKTPKLVAESASGSYDYSSTPSSSPVPSDEDDSEYFEPSNKPTRSSTRRKVVISESEEESLPPSAENSESDDWYPSKKARPKTNRRRKKKVSTPPTRSSGRVRNKTNYNEDAYTEELSESMSEGYSRPVKVAELIEGDAIESIHDHRLINENAKENIVDNLEFLIKWQNWSHMHRTWENFSFLKDFKGIKKVENYIKNIAVPDFELRNNPDTNRENIEQRDIHIEMERTILDDYTNVERIIDRREVTPSEDCKSGTQYFCKWKRLPYSACTWEDSDLIAEKFDSQISDFLDRDQHKFIPSRGSAYSTNRPQFKKLAAQPDYLVGGELRDYQLTGVNWMAYLWSRDENGILADEMGLGKTIQTISFISYLFHTQHIYGPFLVVVPLSTIGAWEREFARWAPDMNAICYIGDNASRKVIRDYEFFVSKTKKLKFNVLLTTFELVLKDRAILGNLKWSFLAVDEAHRLKNSESQLHEALKSFSTANRLLITGTPLQNSIRELCALVHFLMPDKFDISDVYDTILTDDTEGQETKIKELHQNLKPYMLRRLKKDVEKSLPKKTELIVRVELTPLQVHYYKNILTKNFYALNKGVGGGNQLSLLNICVELKKASNHPYLFPNAEDTDISKEEQLKGIIENSGKMILLDKLLKRMREAGSRVLIFSQMVRLLDILSDYMALKGYPYQRLDGSVGSEARKKSIEHYNAPGSPDFVFLLSTRAGGLGINLETADTVIIFDSDWNPQNDLQAMARAHRIGQKKHVNVYRFVSRGTMEEDILERAKRKMVLEYCVISQMDTSGQSLLQKGSSKSSNPFSKEELQAILKFGASRMFADDESRKKGLESSLDDILASAEQHETTEAQTSINGGEEFLKQFEVTDYGAGTDLAWDQIIPEEERLRIKQEEESRQAENLLSSRKRRRVNYHEDNFVSGHDTSRSKNGRSQKATELRDRDIRAIYRGLLKFGNVPERYPDIIEEGNLGNLQESLMSDTANEIYETCTTYERKYGPLSNKKAHLISFKGVEGVNVQLVLQRTRDFRLVYKYLRKADPATFHLSLDLKSIHWTVKWGDFDDAMLLLGIYRHGFGNWTKIRDDTTLSLSDKMFLDQSLDSTPRPSHLVRRGDYLLKIYADYIEQKKIKKESMTSPSKKSKEDRSQSEHHGKKARKEEHNGSSKSKAKHEVEDEDSNPLPDESTCIKMLRPVKHELRRLRDESGHLSKSKKVKLIKECLNEIGTHIDNYSSNLKSSRDRATWKNALWGAVTTFWPKVVAYEQLMTLYEKLKV